LSGPVPKLQSLRADAVPVILDLTGLGPGVHVVEPRVPAPEGVTIEGVSPQSIEVSVVQIMTPTPTATPEPTETPTPTPSETSTVTPTPTRTRRP
jgi:hypothetical protein